MNKEQIRAIAIAKGFKLKEQPNGERDLNPYVYDFAYALLDGKWQPIDTLPEKGKYLVWLDEIPSDNPKLRQAPHVTIFDAELYRDCIAADAPRYLPRAEARAAKYWFHLPTFNGKECDV